MVTSAHQIYGGIMFAQNNTPVGDVPQYATGREGVEALSVILQENIPVQVVGNKITFLDNINISDRAAFSVYGRALLCKGDMSRTIEIKEYLSLKVDPTQSFISVCLDLYSTGETMPAIDASMFEAVQRNAQVPESEATQLRLSLLDEYNGDGVETTETVRRVSDSIRAALPNKKITGLARFECGGEVIGTLRGKITAPKKEQVDTINKEVDALVVDVSTDRRKLEFVYGKKMTASFDINLLTNDATDALKGSVEGRIAHLSLERSIFSDGTFADKVVAAKLRD
jgi:hypothetical protein